MLNDFRLQLDRLRAKNDLVITCSDPARSQRLFQFYTRVTEKLLEVERCSIFINDPANDKAWLKCGTGVQERQIEVPAADSIAGRVIMSKKPIIETGLEGRPGVHARIAEETGFITRDVLCVPIKSAHRDEVIGVVQVLNKRGGSFDQRDVETLEEIAYFLQADIERAFLNQEVFGATERLFEFSRKALYSLVGIVVTIFLVIAGAISVLLVAPMFLK